MRYIEIPQSAAQRRQDALDQDMKILRLCLCLVLLTPISPANGTPVAPVDPPRSVDRIEQLPRCVPHAEAGHYFATYDNNSNNDNGAESTIVKERPWWDRM